MSSAKNKRFRRSSTWPFVLGGAIATFALAAGVAAIRVVTTEPSASLVADSVTELGGGGETPPLQALTAVWGLSSRRATCTMCHNIGRHDTSIPAAVWSQRPVVFNSFGAEYRDVLFQKVAPGYGDDIYAVPMRKKKDATRWPELLARDSDGDGYSNGVELTFGSMPGRRDSRPSRDVTQLMRWRTIIVRALRGKNIARLELDPRVRRVGPDTDADRVPDVLERFVGSDPRSPDSTPLVAARRLAVYRQLLLDAGVEIATATR